MRWFALVLVLGCHHKAPAETAYRKPGEAPEVCVERCVQERQMQAISIEAIEENCRRDCGVAEDPK